MPRNTIHTVCVSHQGCHRRVPAASEHSTDTATVPLAERPQLNRLIRRRRRYCDHISARRCGILNNWIPRHVAASILMVCHRIRQPVAHVGRAPSRLAFSEQLGTFQILQPPLHEAVATSLLHGENEQPDSGRASPICDEHVTNLRGRSNAASACGAHCSMRCCRPACASTKGSCSSASSVGSVVRE